MAQKGKRYDLIVIGAGPGGLSAARRAANIHKKNVLLIENRKLGGTCVNVGCVPKKISYEITHTVENMSVYNKYFTTDMEEKTLFKEFNYNKFMRDRTNAVKRLNNIYEELLKKDNVELVRGFAELICEEIDNQNIHSVKVNDTVYTADHVFLASGTVPKGINTEFNDLLSTSDDFFKLADVPKKVVLIGSGYISIELSFILHSWGSDVTVIARNDKVLSHLDELFSKRVYESMIKKGIKVLFKEEVLDVVEEKENNKKIKLNEIEVKKVDEKSQKNQTKKNTEFIENVNKRSLTMTLKGQTIENVNFIISCIGRVCNTEYIKCPIEKQNGYIKVNKNFMTSIQNVYATGDLLGPPYMLAPYAIFCSHRVIDYLFTNKEINEKISENVPSVVFSHPPCATVGLTEKEAKSKYGEENIQIIESSFIGLLHTLMEQDKKPKSYFKMVCKGERVLGVHLFGFNVDEMIQGCAVALKMGASKRDFYETVGVHPTGSEEIVFLPRDK